MELHGRLTVKHIAYVHIIQNRKGHKNRHIDECNSILHGDTPFCSEEFVYWWSMNMITPSLSRLLNKNDRLSDQHSVRGSW